MLTINTKQPKIVAFWFKLRLKFLFITKIATFMFYSAHNRFYSGSFDWSRSTKTCLPEFRYVYITNKTSTVNTIQLFIETCLPRLKLNERNTMETFRIIYFHFCDFHNNFFFFKKAQLLITNNHQWYVLCFAIIKLDAFKSLILHLICPFQWLL